MASSGTLSGSKKPKSYRVEPESLGETSAFRSSSYENAPAVGAMATTARAPKKDDAPLIDPDKLVVSMNDSRIVFWDMFVLLLLFYETWSIPFEIGVAGGHLWKYMGIGGLMLAESVNIVFFCDTILYFFRESKDSKGRLVWRLQDTARLYARGWFVPDLISCVPVDTIAFVSQTRQGSPLFHFLMVLQTLRLLRLSRIQRRLRGSPYLQRFSLRLSMVPMQIGFIFMVALYVAHCMACVWCFASNLEDGKTWIDKYVNTETTELQPGGDGVANIFDMYVLGLYWAAVTMVSLGYGDVTPYTRAEYWICAIAILVSNFLWAWVVASMVDMVGKVEHDRHELDKHLAVINRFSKENRPKERTYQRDWDSLMDEARLYLQTSHVNRQRFQSTSKLNETLGMLSPALRFRVSLAQAETTLLQLPCFSSCRISTVAFLASRMTEISLACGEIILDDDSDILGRERGLYFVNRGACFATERSRYQKEDTGELRLADAIYRSIIQGDVTTDRIMRTSTFKQSKLSLISEDDVWDLDRFIVDRSSPLFRPGRLFAVSFCDMQILPRSAFLEAMEMDPTFKKAVRWRVAQIALKDWAKRARTTQKSYNGDGERVVGNRPAVSDDFTERDFLAREFSIE